MALFVYDAAVACNEIYGDGGHKIGDWTLFARDKSVHDDFGGTSDAYRVYFNRDELLFVIRGSHRTSDWTQNNARIGFNITPPKATEAFAKFSSWKWLFAKKKCYIAGHSLGGGLAQLVGYYTDTPFVAFNPPGMRNSATGILTMKPAGAKEPKYKSWQFDKGCVFRADKDGVSKLPGKFIGKWRIMRVSGPPAGTNMTDSIVHGHSMDQIINAIKTNSVLGLGPRAELEQFCAKATD